MRVLLNEKKNIKKPKKKEKITISFQKFAVTSD